MQSLEGHIFGRYRLLKEIGQGGMATVYQAIDTVKNRHVAIKVLSPAMAQNTQFSERFKRESEVVKNLKHRHILPVLDFGEQDGYAYLVMPYLNTGSLAERIAQGPLTPYEGGRLVAQIASALDYAHKQGVIHRDIKPPNILLDDKGNAYLADFGLAHLLDTSNSLTGSAVIGTPTYISPEQSLGRKVDARSDQYSLGIVLFQLATGKVPFDGETPIAVLVKHVNDPVPMPSSVNPNVPESIENVILKATSKKPDDRFSSLAEMNRTFQAALAHALDPQVNPAPKIDVKTSIISGEIKPDLKENEPSNRRRVIRTAAIIAALLLLLLACPIASTNFLNMLQGGSNPVAGAPSTQDLRPDELTAMAGTIEALQTEAAITPGATTIVQTVVVTSTVLYTMEPSPTLTLTGMLTPTADVTGQFTPTPTRTNGPGPGPGPGPTRTPTRRPPQPTNPPPQPTQPPPHSTNTPQPQPTNTPQPQPTNTQPPQPTNTQPPQPTNTPQPTSAPTQPPYP